MNFFFLFHLLVTYYLRCFIGAPVQAPADAPGKSDVEPEKAPADPGPAPPADPAPPSDPAPATDPAPPAAAPTGDAPPAEGQYTQSCFCS